MSRYELEMTDPFNVVVFETTEQPVSECEVLDILKSRYEDNTLFILKQNSDAMLIAYELKDTEFNECPYNIFCIAKLENGALKYVVLNPELMMEEMHGF